MNDETLQYGTTLNINDDDSSNPHFANVGSPIANQSFCRFCNSQENIEILSLALSALLLKVRNKPPRVSSPNILTNRLECVRLYLGHLRSYRCSSAWRI